MIDARYRRLSCIAFLAVAMLSSWTGLALLRGRTGLGAVANRWHAAVVCRAMAGDSGKLERVKVKKILEGQAKVGDKVKVQGWVRTIRDQKRFSFVEVNDGSALSALQVVADADIPSYSEVGKLTTGAAVEVEGELVQSSGKGQQLEMHAHKVSLVGACPADSYPLQKKRHSQEFLRTIAHLRARTNTISAVARVRSALAFASHEFFQNQGFVYLQSPLITSSDCEGAGEMFKVTTLPIDKPAEIAIRRDGGTDFSHDFFGKPAFLTVSGQLSGETYACALGDIYTFGPTFRSEKSQTTRHLAEFHMIEPEMAFTDMFAAMDNAEAFVKHVVRAVLSRCEMDLEFFNKFVDKTVKQRLQKVAEQPFARISYAEAIRLLQIEIAKDPSRWTYPDLHFGSDLQTEHERWLAESKFGGCVFVHDYPRGIKSFYMRDNAIASDASHGSGEGESSSADRRTVAAFDLLVPGVGELVGGSQREERHDVLLKKMADFNLKVEDYQWYLDLRRFGSVPHSGYGLGFERLVCYVTGVENIRDAIAYPRYPGHAEF